MAIWGNFETTVIQKQSMNILVNYKEKYDTTTTIQRVLTSVQFNFVGICCLDKYHPDIMESVKDGSRNSPLTFG